MAKPSFLVLIVNMKKMSTFVQEVNLLQCWDTISDAPSDGCPLNLASYSKS